MSRKSGASILLLAGGLLALTWLVLPVSSPPLYDSFQGATEPYRYLQPPPGLGQPGRPPTTGRMTVVPLKGASPIAIVATNEVPPQAQMVLQAKALHLTGPVRAITLTIAPVPSPAPPDRGKIDGNVYSFTASAAGRLLSLNPGAKTSIELRGPAVPGSPAIEQYAAGRWTKLTTFTFVNSPYDVAYISKLGSFALILPAAASRSRGGMTICLVIIAVVVLALVGAVLILVGLRRPERA